MAKKKDRAFFICPRWNEVAEQARAAPRIHDRTLRAIKAGEPVARSTLRRALLAMRAASSSMFDVDDYIVRADRAR